MPLPKNVFYGCKALTDITIPKSCVTIGKSAFYQTSISEIDVPDKCVFIDKYVLYSVKNLHMTSSVSYIANDALSTTGLKVFLKESVPAEMVYNGLNLSGTSVELHVTAGSKDAYQSSKSWNNVTNIIDEGNGEAIRLPSIRGRSRMFRKGCRDGRSGSGRCRRRPSAG